MKGSIYAAIVVAVIVLGMGVAVIRTPVPNNPPLVPSEDISNNLQMEPQVAALLDRACKDCHSDRTEWPWYTRVDIVRREMEKDVVEGRSVMNFSEWSIHAGRKPAIAASMLAAACADLQVGRMPPPKYLLIHTHAKVSSDDVKMFCEWSSKEGKRLIQIQRASAK